MPNVRIPTGLLDGLDELNDNQNEKYGESGYPYD
jgi:hypothetical protein